MKYWVPYVIIGLLVYAGIYAYLRNKKEAGEASPTERDCFSLPTTSNTEIFGPAYWKAFHQLAHQVPCSGCRDFAEKFMVFFHDMVNIKLSRPIYDQKNFDEMSELVMKVKLLNNTWPA